MSISLGELVMPTAVVYHGRRRGRLHIQHNGSQVNADVDADADADAASPCSSSPQGHEVKKKKKKKKKTTITTAVAGGGRGGRHPSCYRDLDSRVTQLTNLSSSWLPNISHDIDIKTDTPFIGDIASMKKISNNDEDDLSKKTPKNNKNKKSKNHHDHQQQQQQQLDPFQRLLQQHESRQVSKKSNSDMDGKQPRGGKRKRDDSSDYIKRTKPKDIGIPSTRKPIEPCYFFMKGSCRDGTQCRFSHDVDQPTKLVPCRYYRIGECMKGDECGYSHDLPCRRLHIKGHCYLQDACPFSHAIPLTSLARAFLEAQTTQCNITTNSAAQEHAAAAAAATTTTTGTITTKCIIGSSVTAECGRTDDSGYAAELDLSMGTEPSLPYTPDIPTDVVNALSTLTHGSTKCSDKTTIEPFDDDDVDDEEELNITPLRYQGPAVAGKDFLDLF